MYWKSWERLSIGIIPITLTHLNIMLQGRTLSTELLWSWSNSLPTSINVTINRMITWQAGSQWATYPSVNCLEKPIVEASLSRQQTVKLHAVDCIDDAAFDRSINIVGPLSTEQFAATEIEHIVVVQTTLYALTKTKTWNYSSNFGSSTKLCGLLTVGLFIEAP